MQLLLVLILSSLPLFVFKQIKNLHVKFMKSLDELMEDLEALQLFQFIIWFAFSFYGTHHVDRTAVMKI